MKGPCKGPLEGPLEGLLEGLFNGLFEGSFWGVFIMSMNRISSCVALATLQDMCPNQAKDEATTFPTPLVSPFCTTEACE